MTREEMDRLVRLEKRHFEYKEWLALKYAQDRVFLGHEPQSGYMVDFRRQYTVKERAYILKLIRMQEFANYWMNTFSRKAWRKDLEGESCSFGPK